MKEFYRVLKPNGQLLFLEHVLSPDKKVSFIQNRLNPFYRLFSDGCNLNRNIKNIIQRNALISGAKLNLLGTIKIKEFSSQYVKDYYHRLLTYLKL